MSSALSAGWWRRKRPFSGRKRSRSQTYPPRTLQPSFYAFPEQSHVPTDWPAWAVPKAEIRACSKPDRGGPLGLVETAQLQQAPGALQDAKQGPSSSWETPELIQSKISIRSAADSAARLECR